MSNDDRRMPRLWGIGLSTVGLVAGLLVFLYGQPPTGARIGNAVTVFLGFVVAGWGVTQAEIAHEASKAAREQATAAAEQVEEARLARERAEQDAKEAAAEAAFHRGHADRTLRATIMQRLDAQAPRVLISTESAFSAPLYQWRDGGESYVNAPSTPPSEWFTHIPDQPFKMNEPRPRNIQVQITIGLRFTLIGDVPARIECDSVEQHDLNGMPSPLILEPRQREAVVEYVKVIGASGDYAEAGNSGQPTHGLIWRPRFVVRDLATNTLDEFMLAGAIGVMRRDGDYMSLTPEGVSIARYAEQLPRRYEYFDRPEGKAELGQAESAARSASHV